MNDISKNDKNIDIYNITSLRQIVVVFPKSRSNSYPAALSLAKNADQYAETVIGDNNLFHMAGFDLKPQNAQTISSILRYLNGLKGVQTYVNGNLVVNSYTMDEFLNCYINACQCNDYKAHCNAVKHEYDVFSGDDKQSFTVSLSLSDLFGKSPAKSEKLYLVPCNYIFNYGFRIQKNHPSSSQDQIQAAAVQRSCQICPLLKPQDFRAI